MFGRGNGTCRADKYLCVVVTECFMPFRGIVELCFRRVGDGFLELLLWGPWNRAAPCMLGHPYFNG